VGGYVYGGIQRKDAKVQRCKESEAKEERKRRREKNLDRKDMKCPPHGSGERV